jgi:hypothetical protein
MTRPKPSNFLLKIMEKIMDRHIRDVLESNAPPAQEAVCLPTREINRDSLAAIGNKD